MSQDITEPNPTNEELSEMPLEAEVSGPGVVGQNQAELERFRDLAFRNQADLENFRKRAVREKEEAIKFANAHFLERLIPILDNFELGLNAARVG